ncbi:hypothetical protein ACSQ67_020470 [Phaseolus vulgaris]
MPPKMGGRVTCIGVTLDNIRDFHALIFGGVLTISGRGVHQITPYIADEKTSVSLTVEDTGIEYKMTVKKVKLPPFDAYSKSSGALYAAILFLTIGKSGQTLLDSFLENKVGEILEARQEIAINDGRTGKQKEHDLIRIILTNTWILAPIVVGYVVILFTDFFNRDYDIIFRNSAVMMGGCYILFLFGSTKYRHEQVSDESNVGKIFRICKAACGRRRSDYPASENGYYWKGNVRTNLCYVYGKGVRLKPRVPRLFRWLDKAAILVPEVSPDTEERDGKFTRGYWEHFFVAQASSMTTTNGYDISKLFLIKVAAGKVSRFICFLIMARLRSKRTTYSTSKTFVVTTSIIRIGFGMVCAVICCFVAWKMEFYRLYSLELKIEALYPQFILLGMTEALLEGGLTKLFHAHVAKSMWSFVDSYIELVKWYWQTPPYSTRLNVPWQLVQEDYRH